jgi:regulator of sigma E protease
MINTFYYIVPFLCILGLLVFAHELGHYWAARRAGMKVHEFAIGMGPVLWGFRRKFEEDGRVDETLYSLRAIPLGGFVRIAGMEPNENPDDPGGFETKPWGWRFVTLIAGCVMNFALAALLFCILGFTYGFQVGPENVVEQVVPGQPAARAGMQPGDQIIGVEGRRTTDVIEIRRSIEQHPGKPLSLTVLRGDKPVNVTLTPNSVRREGQTVGQIGVQFTYTDARKRVDPGTALVMGTQMTYKWFLNMIQGFSDLITRRTSSEGIGGPVMIIQQTGQVAKSGLPNLMEFAGLLSINLGFINLLPFPALDGGRLIFLILQLFRIRIDPRKEAYVHALGMLMLLFLIVLVTFRDIRRWIGI